MSSGRSSPDAAPLHQGLIKAQVWLWFVGMMVLSHALAPGRPARHAQAHGLLRLHATPSISAAGLDRRRLDHRRAAPASSRRSCWSTSSRARIASGAEAASSPSPSAGRSIPSTHTPALLNGFGLWVAMMIGLTIVNYGYPIAQLAIARGRLGARHPDRESMMRRAGASTVGATPGSAGVSFR